MVRMINGEFGNEMWVAEDRIEEYKAAGCRLAADSEAKPASKAKSSKKKTDEK